MTLNEFFDKLRFHDWYYEYSDDHDAWRKGRANLGVLLQIAKESPEHTKLFSEYEQYVLHNGTKPIVPN